MQILHLSPELKETLTTSIHINQAFFFPFLRYLSKNLSKQNILHVTLIDKTEKNISKMLTIVSKCQIHTA